MCQPISISAATMAAAASAASGAAKAASSIFGGVSARNAAQANARMADENAAYANRQAGDAVFRGSDEVAKHYLQQAQLAGRQTAAMAANGIELGFGSPLEVLASTAALGEIDAEALRENARREAEGYRMAALNQRQEAASYRARGQAALVSGLIDGFDTLLGTASQISRKGAGLRAG